MNNIPNNIKKFRQLLGISQEELAKKAKMSRNYLNLIENGKREPTVSTLNAISKALGVPISILLLEINSRADAPLDKLLLKVYEVATRNITKN
jgi:putative transcriptional regulator